MQLKFTVWAKAEPQGSMKGFVIPAKDGRKARAILTSANTKMKPYRGQVRAAAMSAMREAGMQGLMAPKHVPVSMVIDFYFERPPSIPKKRTAMVVKPDLSKILRSTEDAMTGCVYFDDSQVVDVNMRKHYGSPERVEVSVYAENGNLFSLQELEAAVF